jgi:hypothetical protein
LAAFFLFSSSFSLLLAVISVFTSCTNVSTCASLVRAWSAFFSFLFSSAAILLASSSNAFLY